MGTELLWGQDIFQSHVREDFSSGMTADESYKQLHSASTEFSERRKSLSLNSVSGIATNLLWALRELLGMFSTAQLTLRSHKPDPRRGDLGQPGAGLPSDGTCPVWCQLPAGGTELGVPPAGCFFLHLAVIEFPPLQKQSGSCACWAVGRVLCLWAGTPSSCATLP